MTKRQQIAAAKYAADLAGRMGLRDWSFDLQREPADEGKAAQVQTIYGQKHANLWLGEGFFGKAPEAQRHILVHEFVHCHLTVNRHMVTGSYLSEKLGEPAAEVFEEAYIQAQEYAVDGLAVVIAESMPLPRLPR